MTTNCTAIHARCSFRLSHSCFRSSQSSIAIIVLLVLRSAAASENCILIIDITSTQRDLSGPPDYDTYQMNTLNFNDERKDSKAYPREICGHDEEHTGSNRQESPPSRKAFFEAIEQQEQSPLLKEGPSSHKGAKWATPWMKFLCAVLLISACGFLFHSLFIKSESMPLSAEPRYFDYIIVGGGPAGILVATKLAESFPGLRLVLLESGTASQAAVLNDKNLNFMDIPLFWSGVASARERRQALPMPFASGHHWPIDKTLLGRGLGGSGLHNAMLYVRSLSRDIESWNMSEWRWEDILAEYIDLEEFRTVPEKVDGRGSDGLIATAYPSKTVVDAIAPLFLQSANLTGWPILSRGFNNGGDRVGMGYYEFNIKHGIRDSVAQALLGRRKPPANLEIRTGLTVTRVLLEHDQLGLSACGVEFRTEMGPIRKYMLADSSQAEVILSAGAIMSPQILVNSGIGPNGYAFDLPGVGKNLQDHPVVGLSFSINSELAMEASSIYTIGDELEDYLVSVQELHDLGANVSELSENNKTLLFEKLGTFGTAGFSAGGFLRSPWATDETPDIQLTVFPRLTEPHIVRHANHDKLKRLRASAMLVTVALLKPDGRYQVYASAPCNKTNFGDDPFFNHESEQVKESESIYTIEGLPLRGYGLPTIGLPLGRKEYLSRRDAQRLAWGVEEVRRIQMTVPLSMHTGSEIYPGSQMTGEDLLKHISENHLPNSHWVGSTKIGPVDDPDSVVDGRLKIRGVGGLRVVDGGVIPHAPSGNTHSTVCALASRAAKLIEQDRKRV